MVLIEDNNKIVLQEFEYLMRENRAMVHEYVQIGKYRTLAHILNLSINKIISLSNHLANLNEFICDADNKVFEAWNSYKQLR